MGRLTAKQLTWRIAKMPAAFTVVIVQLGRPVGFRSGREALDIRIEGRQPTE